MRDLYPGQIATMAANGFPRQPRVRLASRRQRFRHRHPALTDDDAVLAPPPWFGPSALPPRPSLDSAPAAASCSAAASSRTHLHHANTILTLREADSRLVAFAYATQGSTDADTRDDDAAASVGGGPSGRRSGGGPTVLAVSGELWRGGAHEEGEGDLPHDHGPACESANDTAQPEPVEPGRASSLPPLASVSSLLVDRLARLLIALPAPIHVVTAAAVNSGGGGKRRHESVAMKEFLRRVAAPEGDGFTDVGPLRERRDGGSLDEEDLVQALRTSAGISLSEVSAVEFSHREEALSESLRMLWPARPLATWRSALDLDSMSHAQTGALACLLRLHVQHGRPVTNVCERSPPDITLMSRATAFGLHVRHVDEHPAAAAGIGCPKEGLSLLSLLDRCATAGGSALIAQWLRFPTNDVALLRERQQTIAGFASVAFRERLPELVACLRRVRNVPNILGKIRQLKHSTTDLDALVRTGQAMTRIAQLCDDLHCIPAALSSAPLQNRAALDGQGHCFVRPACLADFYAALGSTFQSMRRSVDAIAATVDVTVDKGDGVHPRQGVDARIDEFRLAYHNLDTFLTQMAQKEVQALPAAFDRPISVVFFPQLGYLIRLALSGAEGDTRHDVAALNAVPPGALMDAMVPDEWEHAFTTDGAAHYKSNSMRDLDANIGDLRSALVDLECEVLQRLYDTILREAAEGAWAAVPPLWEVDALLSFAMVAVEEQWVCPRIGETPHLRLRACRHPLLSRVTNGVIIAADFELGVEPGAAMESDSGCSARRVAVVAGPNGSGKSVFIRAVALTAVLAHVGSFVPCEYAEVGPMDLIAVNGAPLRESGGNRHGAPAEAETTSSFGQELCVVSRAFATATRNSLIILDEFGCGTLAEDGISLLAAYVRYCIDLGGNSPLLLLATHYSELFQPGVVNPGDVSCLTMASVLDESALSPEDGVAAGTPPSVVAGSSSLVFLYRPLPTQVALLAEGTRAHRGCANALACARAARLPPPLLAEAECNYWLLREGGTRALLQGCLLTLADWTSVVASLARDEEGEPPSCSNAAAAGSSAREGAATSLLRGMSSDELAVMWSLARNPQLQWALHRAASGAANPQVTTASPGSEGVALGGPTSNGFG